MDVFRERPVGILLSESWVSDPLALSVTSSGVVRGSFGILPFDGSFVPRTLSRC